MTQINHLTDDLRFDRRAAFTMVELMVSILIIFMLMGLLLVGLRQMVAAGRHAVDRTTISSLDVGVKSFKDEFGFAPPLVKDIDGPLNGGTPNIPLVYLMSDQSDRDDLRDAEPFPNADKRYSIYSLPYYLLGILGEDVDGIEGPGFVEPLRNGSFKIASGPASNRTGRRFEPFFNAGSYDGAVQLIAPEEGRIELRDRSGSPFRYYRWIRGDASGAINTLSDLNIPWLVGDPAENESLRSAEYAVVGAGPNGVFGDEDTAFLEAKLNMRGQPADQIARAAAVDNVVGVGR